MESVTKLKQELDLWFDLYNEGRRPIRIYRAFYMVEGEVDGIAETLKQVESGLEKLR